MWFVPQVKRGSGRRAAVVLAVVAVAGAVAAGLAGARSGPVFSIYSASGDIANWRVSFTETGLTPKSHVNYLATAQTSVTYGPEGISPPACADGSLPVLSSYALYNVRLVDLTSHVNAPSMRDHTTPRPR